MIAARYSRTDSTENTVQILLDAGADVNITNDGGYTALMIAALFSGTDSTEKTVKMILGKRPNLLLKNKVGETAWSVAKKDGTQGALALIESALNEPVESPPAYVE
jgi:ankyrin repeat protein